MPLHDKNDKITYEQRRTENHTRLLWGVGGGGGGGGEGMYPHEAHKIENKLSSKQRKRHWHLVTRYLAANQKPRTC